MFIKSKLKRRKKSEEVDPMSGIVNLADAMLVFVCGLLVALILNSNLNISSNLKQIDISKGKSVENSEEIEKKSLDKSKNEKEYEKLGTVYKDPDTGKTYLVTDEKTEE